MYKYFPFLLGILFILVGCQQKENVVQKRTTSLPLPRDVSHLPKTVHNTVPMSYATRRKITKNRGVIKDKIPVIEVKLHHNGKTVPAMMILDTGASVSTLRKGVARQLQLKIWQNSSRKIEGMILSWASIDGVQVDKETFPSQVIVWDDDVLKSGNLQTDGIIGLDILARTTMVIDPLKQKILITTGPVSIHYNTVVDLLENEGVFSIQARVNNRERQMMLDTGAWKTFVYQDIVPKSAFISVSPQEKVSTVNGEVAVHSARIDLQVATLAFPRLPVGVEARPRNERASDLLGMDVLSTRPVVIDFPRKKMYWKTK